MSETPWNPRGEPSWPDWKKAKPGARIAHVRSGRTGTLVRAVVSGRGRGGGHYAVICWDPCPEWPHEAIGRVVSPAFDLRPLT
jgi:hypothetical protein